jgi:hypothetical protein
MPDDNSDLTTRRVDSKWRALLAEFVSIYQKTKEPKLGFWPAWDAEEPILVTKLKQRPLALAEIENSFSAFRSKMLRAL